MTKSELIEAVRKLNSTASTDFLSQFDIKDLENYIDNLVHQDRSNLTASQNLANLSN